MKRRKTKPAQRLSVKFSELAKASDAFVDALRCLGLVAGEMTRSLNIALKQKSLQQKNEIGKNEIRS